MDGLTAAYFVAFVAGAGFSIVSWVLGAVGSHGDGGHHGGGEHGGTDAHGDADADADADAASDAGEEGQYAVVPAEHGVLAHGHHGALAHGHDHALAHHGHDHGGLAGKIVGPLLNLSSLAALSCVGGGAGLIARRAGAGAPLSFLVAVPSGLAAAYLIGSLIAWLKRESRFKEATQLGGSLATVLAPVSSEHLGEIMYTVEGARTTLAARSSSTTVLQPGTEVVILDVKDGIARVGAATELLGTEPAPAATPRRLPTGEKEGPK
jgi:membrane protein implicated in regulation of membrane protease activity